MGSSLSCCHHEKNDSNANEIFIEKGNKIQTKGIVLTTEKNDWSESPKFNNFNIREDLALHLKKASGKLDDVQEDCYFENLEGFEEKNCPFLNITMTAISWQEKRKLNINYTGLIDSIRGASDGIIFFGCINENCTLVLDVNLNSEKSYISIDEKSIGKHFCIYFDTNILQYNLRDLGKGMGVFYKIDSEIILKNNAVINLDQNFIFVGIDEENGEELTLKIYTEGGNNTFDPM